MQDGATGKGELTVEVVGAAEECGVEDENWLFAKETPHDLVLQLHK
jgi:hypothetical protein